MSYKVYKLSFARLTGVDHVALYVATSDNSGTLFHATDNPTESSKEEVKMKYESKPYAPDGSASLNNTIEIGTVAKHAFGSFESVCRQVGDPSGPRKRKDRPNCVTWLDNAVHDLHQNGMLTIKRGYQVPSSKKSLQVPVLKPAEGKKGSSAS